jgi:nicotinamide-nucleotide amidase
MKAIEFIAIGSELLNHRRQDSNSTWVAEKLKTLGLFFKRKSIVGDVREEIVKILKESFDRSDLVIVCGGLGPTFDDLTREAIADAFDVPLEYHESIALEITQFFKSRGREIAPSNLKQAYLPKGAVSLTNELGTAPGIKLTLQANNKEKVFFFLPGVPRELQVIWNTFIHPQIEASLLGLGKVQTRRFVTAGVPESTLNDRTEPFRAKYAEAEWTILANLSQVEFLVSHTSIEYLEAISSEFVTFLADDLVGLGDTTLESALLELLKDRSETLSLAESMTGGLIASRLCAIPGASTVLVGGAVVYSSKLKKELLGISEKTLQLNGPTSEAVAMEMASSLQIKSESTYSIAITGNAGPELDSHSRELLGEGHIAIAGKAWGTTKKFHLHGSRLDIQTRSSALALDLLRREILNRNP